MTIPVLTLARMREAGACDSACRRFAKSWGESVIVTRELCVAHAAEYHWHWAAEHLLTAPAEAAYRAAITSAETAYRAAIASAKAAYQAAITSAEAAYRAAITPAETAYQAAIASAWADAFIAQETSS